MMYLGECVSDYMARYASVDEKIVQALTKNLVSGSHLRIDKSCKQLLGVWVNRFSVMKFKR